jgi:hypothetical protein
VFAPVGYALSGVVSRSQSPEGALKIRISCGS